MNKIYSLYTSFLNELNENPEKFQIKTEKLERLIEILETILNQNDFSNIEEILNEAITEAEESGFRNGTKYAFDFFTKSLKK